MRFLLRHRPSPSMAVAFAALIVALSGTAYAAVNLPANSVGTKQLKKHAVSLVKISISAQRAPGSARLHRTRWRPGRRGTARRYRPRGAPRRQGRPRSHGSQGRPRSHRAHGVPGRDRSERCLRCRYQSSLIECARRRHINKYRQLLLWGARAGRRDKLRHPLQLPYGPECPEFLPGHRRLRERGVGRHCQQQFRFFPRLLRIRHLRAVAARTACLPLSRGSGRNGHTRFARHTQLARRGALSETVHR